MQIFEIKRPDTIAFKFSTETEVWHLSAAEVAIEERLRKFCVDLCKFADIRKKDDNNPDFTEREVLILIKFFRSRGFVIDKRDAKLENDLKEALSILDPNNHEALESLEYLSYNQQYELAQKLNQVFG